MHKALGGWWIFMVFDGFCWHLWWWNAIAPNCWCCWALKWKSNLNLPVWFYRGKMDVLQGCMLACRSALLPIAACDRRVWGRPICDMSCAHSTLILMSVCIQSHASLNLFPDHLVLPCFTQFPQLRPLGCLVQIPHKLTSSGVLRSHWSRLTFRTLKLQIGHFLFGILLALSWCRWPLPMAENLLPRPALVVVASCGRKIVCFQWWNVMEDTAALHGCHELPFIFTRLSSTKNRCDDDLPGMPNWKKQSEAFRQAIKQVWSST